MPDGAIATSSTTVRRWHRGTVSFHHLVDPRTGGPVESRWRTVTVAAPTCVDANTAATAAIVLGDAGLDLVIAAGRPARLVALDGDVFRVNGWPEPSPRPSPPPRRRPRNRIERSIGRSCRHEHADPVVRDPRLRRRLADPLQRRRLPRAAGRRPGVVRRAGRGSSRSSSTGTLRCFRSPSSVIHIVTAVLDPFTSLGFAAAVSRSPPRTGRSRSASASISVDLALAVIVTSLLRERIGQRAWRAVHWAAYGAWPLAVAHTITAGSDASAPWMLGIDAACCSQSGPA